MYLFSKQIKKNVLLQKQFLFHLRVVRSDIAAVAAQCEAWLGNNHGEAEDSGKDRSRGGGSGSRVRISSYDFPVQGRVKWGKPGVALFVPYTVGHKKR